MFAKDFRKNARDALKGNWGLAVLTGLVAALLAGTGGNSGFNVNISDRELSHFVSSEIIGFIFGFAFFYAIISIIIGGVVEIGYKRFNMKLLKNENPQFTDLFGYINYITKGVGLVIIRGIFTFLWSLLFIIPGIIASYRYALMPYILADNPNLTVMEAMNSSKEMMYGNKWRLFCLHFSFFGWSLLAGLTMGIGYLWLAPYIAAAEASFYESLKSAPFTVNEPTFDSVNWDE